MLNIPMIYVGIYALQATTKPRRSLSAEAKHMMVDWFRAEFRSKIIHGGAG
jgi:hypothetical protein